MNQQAALRRRVAATCPSLAIESVRLIDSGQFNRVLIVNDEWIFRFPRYASQARQLPAQVELLRRIRRHLDVSIPDPVYASLESASPGDAFIGYPLIAGVPLRRELLHSLADEAYTASIRQLATFLRDLHDISPSTVSPGLPNQDSGDRWADLYRRIRARLFALMRPDARSAVTEHFESFLDDPRSFEYEPVMRHGDVGPDNVLFDPATQRVSGVIDFDFAGPGDPATDLAIVLRTRQGIDVTASR